MRCQAADESSVCSCALATQSTRSLTEGCFDMKRLNSAAMASVVCLIGMPAMAQVQCGATISGIATMVEDLACDEPLTLDGGTLQMRGYTYSCKEGVAFDNGFRVQGRSSRVLDGIIEDCLIPLFVGGLGGHTIRNVHVIDSGLVALQIVSDRNVVIHLTSETTSAPPTLGAMISGSNNRISDSNFKGRLGLSLFGNRNALQRSNISGTQAGLSVDGTNHSLIGNELLGSNFYGISVHGSGHMLQSNVSNNNGGDGFAIFSTSTRLINNEAFNNGLGSGLYDIADWNLDCANNLYRANRFGAANQVCVLGRERPNLVSEVYPSF
jgi:hypothetical protein